MINARAARRFTLDGKTYQKDDPIPLPDNQFDDLASVGLVVARAGRPTRALADRIGGVTRKTNNRTAKAD